MPKDTVNVDKTLAQLNDEEYAQSFFKAIADFVQTLFRYIQQLFDAFKFIPVYAIKGSGTDAE